MSAAFGRTGKSGEMKGTGQDDRPGDAVLRKRKSVGRGMRGVAEQIPGLAGECEAVAAKFIECCIGSLDRHHGEEDNWHPMRIRKRMVHRRTLRARHVRPVIICLRFLTDLVNINP